LFFVSQLGYVAFPEFSLKWFRYLGQWKQHQFKPDLIPIGGICYWLSPPTPRTISSDPIQAIIYVVFMLFSCTLFSRLSISDPSCEENPDKLTRDLLGPTHLTLAEGCENSDEALKNEIARLVPIAATLGGLTLGSVCVIGDILGTFGGGQGMLVMTSIMYRNYESWLKDR
jgi:protein transport protein SEC61 subunit alpha